MEKKKAKLFFKAAKDYVGDNDPDNKWVRGLSPETFKRMTLKEFLEEYCQVIYRAGFKASIIDTKINGIKKAFKDFDIEKICKMKSVEPVLLVFNSDRKAKSFSKGAQLIYKEGFSKFKERIQKQGARALEELPGIGVITWKHLARNIGFADVAKDDVHLQRLVEYLDAADEKELTGYLSGEFGEKKGVVDYILWRFCEQKGWKTGSLKGFIASL